MRGWKQGRREHLPPGYYLEQPPHFNLVVLRKRDGYFVAAFSLSGVEREAIEEVAWLDFRGAPMAEAASEVGVRGDQEGWEPSMAESQLSELQNMRVLLEEARVQARSLAYHRRARLETVIGQALEELERQIEELRALRG